MDWFLHGQEVSFRNRCMMAERFGKMLMRLMYFRVKRSNLKEFVFWTATSGVP